MIKVFVIVVTYNGENWIDKCVLSLRESVIPLQTIVIDNASSDETILKINRNYPEVELIRGEVNIGFGQANNIGIKRALENDADYVFLLNQDAWIEPDTIQNLVDLHLKNREFGILSPLHLNSTKNIIEESFSGFIVPPYTSKVFLNDLYYKRLKGVYETSFVNAAAWLVSKECIESVGGFDPIFFHYEEDMNYVHRAIFHGFKIGFCPDVTVCHDCANRIMEQRHIDQMYYNRLTTHFVDINNKKALDELRQLLAKSFFKSISSLFRFNYRKLNENWSLMKFLRSKRIGIIKSREINIRKGKHYLD
jgi:GT2 family glycosyltransferase